MRVSLLVGSFLCWAWGVLARVVGWALGCGVSARDVGGSLFFF